MNRYKFGNVWRKLEARHQGLFDPLRTPAMVHLIAWHCDRYFRWFHSGDVQGEYHLRNIVRIAEHVPDVQMWLPTRELATVRAVGLVPPNLTVRVSGHTIDGKAPDWPVTSVVTRGEAQGHQWPSRLQSNSCGDCREGWNPETPTVVSKLHGGLTEASGETAMKFQRLLIALTVVNLGLLVFLLVQVRRGTVLRGRALEIVDDRGRVRARIKVQTATVFKPTGKAYPENVILRLIDPNGRPTVKLGASIEGAGLGLVGAADSTHVILEAEGAESRLKLTTEDGRERVVRPSHRASLADDLAGLRPSAGSRTTRSRRED
jgi:hypothetical protein